MYKEKKVVIIGTGFVGMSFAYASLNQGAMDTLILIDTQKSKAEGEAMDLNHGLAFAPKKMNIRVGDYSDCADADVVVITAGVSQTSEGETRIDLLARNAKIMKSITNSIMKYDFKGTIIVASNPVDILSYVVYKESGLTSNRVIGSGTTLDSARLRYELSEFFTINSTNIHGVILGEHGDSEFVPWSNVYIGTKSIGTILSENKNINEEDLEKIYVDVRDAAYDIIDRKGATYYGIGMSLVKIVKAIIYNENSILPISTLVNDEYEGIKNVYIGVPVILNKSGISKIIRLELTDKEKEKLKKSANILRSALSSIDY